MTYLEDLRARYPEKPEIWLMDYVAGCCPNPMPPDEKCQGSCEACWNQEMPEEESKGIATGPAGPRNDAMTGLTAEREGAILEGALLKWGEAAQAIKAIEELSELESLLAKWAVHEMVGGAMPRWPGDEALARAIREELADAYIMLEQMEMVFGDVAEIEEQKLLRLEEDLEDASE